MIKIHQINKRFRTQDIETTALSEISFDLQAGEFLAVMGPSGCGKSTLLNILGMLDSPDTGDYFFQNQNIARLSEAKLSQIRKRHVGFIFQSFNLIEELTVFENVELALLYQGYSAKERRQRVDAILEKMDIAHRRRHLPHQLSGGQQQRAAVARALVSKPSLILADEPTGNLDSQRGQEVMSLLRQLNSEGTSVIMVTHSAEHAAYAHRRLNLFDGKLIATSQFAVV